MPSLEVDLHFNQERPRYTEHLHAGEACPLLLK